MPLHAAAPPLQKCEQGGFINTTVGACGLGVATTIGNLATIVIFVQSSTITISSFSGPNTWHTIGPVLGTGNETFIAWSVITSAQTTMQVNFSNPTSGDFASAEYTNMAGVGTVADCNSAGSSGNSTALTSGSCTPTASNDLLIGGGGSLANSLTYTAGGSFTIEGQQAHSTQGNSYAWEDVNSAACTSQSASMTASGSAQWSMIMAAFKTSAPTGCDRSGSKMSDLERYE